MRPVALLLAALLLSGCVTSWSSSMQTVTTAWTETIHEGSVDLAPGETSAVHEFEVPSNVTRMQILLETTGTAINLGGEATGCSPTTGSNLVVAGASRASLQCQEPPEGTFRVTVRREAGVGPVAVKVVADRRVTETS